MRRLPKQRFFRGLLRAGVITPADIPLIERKMREGKRYQSLNVHFTENRGHRWADKLQAFAKWLWQHRQAIFEILGLVLMFAEDGKPYLMDAEEADKLVKKENKKAARKPRKKKVKETPSGEKVEDFTSREEVLDELTAESQSLGLYDIGETSGDKDDEVQPRKDGSEATGGFQSDDV